MDKLRKIFRPIEREELPKFLPMALMMFFVLFNYSMLRSIKDGLVVTGVGAEAIGFMKTYVVLPSAILTMIIYTKLCNIFTQQKIFYIITGFFAAYFAIFGFVLYPNIDSIHPDTATVESFAQQFPRMQWFIKIYGKWIYATFYTMAELWGTIMTSLLFWQFANQITKTEEAKRFYSMFGMLGNLGLVLTGVVLGSDDADNVSFPYFMLCITLGVVAIMALYWWMNAYILTDKKYYDPESKKSSKKNKPKLSMWDSTKMILCSKYLGLIAVLVLAYGISISLVEGVWKSKISQLHPDSESYISFMGKFQMWQGLGAIFFMIIGSNILRSVSWATAAVFTPIMIMITGCAFFSFIFFEDIISLYMVGIFTSTPLALAVMFGAAQNILSKATKYSLFDSTKEMTYIPLDNEMKTKGKAAVDIMAGRSGKSGGGIIQSTFFILFPSYSFLEATPFFASIFFIITVLWIIAVGALNKEYHHALEASSM